MSVLSLEQRRAHRQLAEFCQRRNAQAGNTGAGLSCLQEDEATLLLVSDQGADRGKHERRALLRLVRDGHDWQLYWPRADGQWEVYAPLPRATDFSQVIDQLEQAPLAVHW